MKKAEVKTKRTEWTSVKGEKLEGKNEGVSSFFAINFYCLY